MPRLGDDPLSRRRRAPRAAGPQDALFVPSVPSESLQYPETPVEVPVAGPESSGAQTVTITVISSQPPESFAEAPSAPSVPAESVTPSPEPAPLVDQSAPQEETRFLGRIFDKLRG